MSQNTSGLNTKEYKELRQNSQEELDNMEDNKIYIDNNKDNHTTHRNYRPIKNQDSNSEVTSNNNNNNNNNNNDNNHNDDNNNNSRNDIASSSTSVPEDPKLKKELDEYIEKQKEILSSPVKEFTKEEYGEYLNEYERLLKLHTEKKITPEQKEELNEHYQTLAKFQYQHISPEQKKEYLEKQRRHYKERKIREAENKKKEMYDNLRYYSKEISSIIRPVILCICLSILWVKLTNKVDTQQIRSQDLNLISSNNNDNTTNNQENDSESFDIWKLLNSFANAGIIIGNIIIATFVILCLFKYNHTKILYGLFIFTVFMLIGIFGYNLLYVLIDTYNIPMDWFTLTIFMLNLSVVGVIVIFWKGPPRIQQGYLVLMSSLMAFSLTGFADYTTWFLLALLACWDLIAVLCPFGPLKMLVEHSDSNNQMIPQALIYSTMVWMMAQDVRIKIKDNNENNENNENMLKNGLTHNPSTLFDECEASSSCSTKELIDSKQKKLNEKNNENYNIKINDDEDSDISNSSDQINEISSEKGDNLERKSLTNSRRSSRRSHRNDHDNNNNRETQDSNSDDEDEEGLKLGLGDFVFYSVLIARAAMHDWLTTFSCAIAVLTGLTLTIFLLSIYQKALPALPISIAFGIIFYIFSSSMLGPLMKYLTRITIAERNMQSYTDLKLDMNNGCSFVYL